MDPARTSARHTRQARLVLGSEGHHSLLLANRALSEPMHRHFAAYPPPGPYSGARQVCHADSAGVFRVRKRGDTSCPVNTRQRHPTRSDHPPADPTTRAVPCTSATARHQRKPTSCHHHDGPTQHTRMEHVMSTALAVVADDATVARLTANPDSALSPVARLVLTYADTFPAPAPLATIARQLRIGTVAAESAAAELTRHGLAQTVQVAA